jgi:hypothetical protein
VAGASLDNLASGKRINFEENMNERLSLTSGRARTGSCLQELLLVRFHLLCMVGLLNFITTFSAQAECVQMNLCPLATYAVLGLGTANCQTIDVTRPEALMSLGPKLHDINGDKGHDHPGDLPTDKDNLRRNDKSDAGSGGLRPISKLNAWVQIVGGLALLIGIQRLRKHRV